MNSLANGLYTILEWIMKFAYINVLWVLFTLAGGVIFGIFPSTIAMFSIIRKWLTVNPDIPVFKTFWEYFKQEFLKSNRLGIVIIFISLLVGLDIYYIQSSSNDMLTWTYIPLFAFILLFIFFLFYLFPVFVHYDLKVRHIMKHAFLIMLISPVHLLLMILCLASLYFVMYLLPATAVIFGGSAYAFITMWLSLHAFNRIQQKQERNK
ncbi:YesL family protein [Virgibacillus ainsalahensis]